MEKQRYVPPGNTTIPPPAAAAASMAAFTAGVSSCFPVPAAPKDRTSNSSGEPEPWTAGVCANVLREGSAAKAKGESLSRSRRCMMFIQRLYLKPQWPSTEIEWDAENLASTAPRLLEWFRIPTAPQRRDSLVPLAGEIGSGKRYCLFSLRQTCLPWLRRRFRHHH